MFRIILPLVLAIAGCAAPPPPAPAQQAITSDPVLLATFFGPGDHRAISPVIRCPIRCQAAR